MTFIMSWAGILCLQGIFSIDPFTEGPSSGRGSVTFWGQFSDWTVHACMSSRPATTRQSRRQPEGVGGGRGLRLKYISVLDGRYSSDPRPPTPITPGCRTDCDLWPLFSISELEIKKTLNEKCEFNSNLLLTDDSSHLFSHHAPHWCNNPSLLSLLPTGRQIVTQLTRSRAKCQTRSAPLGVPGEITTLRKCLRF